MLSYAIATTTVTFTNNVGSNVDPDVVTLRYHARNEPWVVKNYPGDVTRSSAGVYTYQIPCDATGDWYVEWYGETTTLQKTISTTFEVEQ